MENKIKVLLADNSEHFGIPCANVMRSHGLDVETVEKDGRQLLGSIERGHPDVVIMDFFLPRLDAIGVIKSVQTTAASKPQFMVMSSFDNPNLEREAMLAGADYYFLKPFDTDEMAERHSVSVQQKAGGIHPLRQARRYRERQPGNAGDGNHPSNRCAGPYQRISVPAGCHPHGH